MAEPEARHDITDRADVERFVRDFYREAAMDDVLGPVFAAARVNWHTHIGTLVDFWSWQLLGERGYEGNPLVSHRPVHARTPLDSSHYERWVELFHTTIDEAFVGPVAELAKGRGSKMAAAMRRLLDGVSAPGSTPTDVTFVGVGGR